MINSVSRETATNKKRSSPHIALQSICFRRPLPGVGVIRSLDTRISSHRQDHTRAVSKIHRLKWFERRTSPMCKYSHRERRLSATLKPPNINLEIR